MTNPDTIPFTRSGARGAVQLAVKRGELPKPTEYLCVDCGKPAAEYDHYKGYSWEHRLAVEPVCENCHAKRTHQRRRDDLPEFRMVPDPVVHVEDEHGLAREITRRELNVEKVCPQCGEAFKGIGRQRYCSLRCQKLADYQRHHEKRLAAKRESYRRQKGEA